MTDSEKGAIRTPAANKRRRRGLSLSSALNVALIVAFTLLIVWSFTLVRDKLLSNAHDMGTNLAKSYASEEQARFDSFERLLEIGTLFVDDGIDENLSADELQGRIETYAGYLSEVLGSEAIEPYAVIDGRFVASGSRKEGAGYDYADASWYLGALSQPDAIFYTDVYTDAVTEKHVVTLSAALAGEGNVIALDISLEDFRESDAADSLPRDSSYFLTDADGRIIYASSTLDLDDERTQSYLSGLIGAILDGRLVDYDDTIADIEGTQRVVYYSVLDSGWISVVTIPVGTVLQDGWDTTMLALSAICVGLIVVLAATTVREHLKNRAMRHVSETLELLGDTFYAIYRIDMSRGRYETVKSSPDVRPVLKKEGSYDRLLATVGDVVEESTHTAFVDSFSLEHMRELFRSGVREFGGDYQRRFDGEYKWVSIRVIVSDEVGIDEAVMSFREIDEEKRREIQRRVLLENALSTAEQASKRKSELVSNVSHDMRTPLGAIIGLAELAQRDVGNVDKTRSNLARIEQSGRQMLALVNDVLDMSRIEHGGDGLLDLAPVDLAALVRSTAALFEVQAQRDGKTVVVETPDEPEIVYADELRMGQVLMNLVSNAMKYTEDDGTVRVSLRRATDDDALREYQIVVSDDGIGMSEEFLSRIFEPFARETMFSPKDIAGTGLGMPIVKNLVTQMDGDIAIESELGRGTTVTVTLPLRAVEKRPDGEGATEGSEGASRAFEADAADARKPDGLATSPEADAPEEPPARAAESPLVLVADDTDINREILQEYLAMLGARTVHARNGREAVEVFARSAPGEIACVFMDMRMPEMDGCEAAEAIRAMDRPDAGSVPIIAITANTAAEDVARTSAAGMNGHVTKPVDFMTFSEVFRSVLPR